MIRIPVLHRYLVVRLYASQNTYAECGYLVVRCGSGRLASLLNNHVTALEILDDARTICGVYPEAVRKITPQTLSLIRLDSEVRFLDDDAFMKRDKSWCLFESFQDDYLFANPQDEEILYAPYRVSLDIFSSRGPSFVFNLIKSKSVLGIEGLLNALTQSDGSTTG